ncbi:MAG: phenylalanine--tRNA ligase subunit beta [Chloroflexi bacterium]|nr:phenylalanine--tRNA ligase subunit beta [Chloroflexota bacterium]MDA1239912.1 phenylalanine--tRNA ligase subunit beta [Chloroflexota bacterium]
MLVSLKWLREYVDLPADLDVDDLAHRLTMASAEIEGVHRVGAQWDRDLIRVGAALSVEPHPNADRLRLVTVDFGGAEPQRVVCGAPNVAAGQKIAFAQEGARVLDGHSGKEAVLKRAAIRGVESAGMVLSEKELGLSDAHEGIIVLPADAPVGTPLVDYLGDVILDVHVWPNRADMMSMVGVAREVGAILSVPMRMPAPPEPAGGAPVAEAVSVRIDDPDLCWRYVAMVIEGVQVGSSPRWLQERLRAAGQRPISNVVDITNYVMLELGQPLHAFDLDAVRGEVGVRLAREGEQLRTLDGVDRVLATDTLLITDESGPIALAGVMGGETTEVREHTTRILLEAARFDPTSIRRTSTRLALRSEASSRFERGLSPELAMVAARRAAQLFVEFCGGTARAGAVDVYPVAVERPSLSITRARLDTVIGVHVPTPEVTGILETLGFEVLETDGGRVGGTFAVRAPWWRTDIAIADDIAEEVVRLAGYDRLPAAAIAGGIPAWEPAPVRDMRDRLTDALVEAGLQEVITYSLTTDEVLGRVIAAADLAIIRPLRLRNTLSSDRQVMRPTLRHSILETIARGIRSGTPRIAIFEAGRAYIPRREDGQVLPEEREVVCGAVTGFDLDRWGRATDRRLDFFDAKGMIESGLAALRLHATYVAHEEFGLMRGRTARLEVGGEPVGVLAEVHPDTLAQFEIEQPVLLFELDVAKLAARQPERAGAQSVSRFPAMEQDLAVVVDAGVTASAIQAVLEGSPLVASARVFDVFTGGRLPEGKKSIAFSIRYQVPNRTLTGEDASREQAKLVKRLEREFGAEQRA